MKKIIVTLLAVGLMLLAGCAAPTSDLVTSAEDIIGTTWHRISAPGPSGYLQFYEDGTAHTSSNRELVNEQPLNIFAFRFEGTQFFVEQTSRGFCEENEVGVYELHLLENGNLQFAAIEDECAQNASLFQGIVAGEITAEWEPVP